MSKNSIIDILAKTEQTLNLISGVFDVFDKLDETTQDDVIMGLSKDIQANEQKGAFKDAVDMIMDEGIEDEPIMRTVKELADRAKELYLKMPQGITVNFISGAVGTAVWDYLNRICVNFRYGIKYIPALKTDKPDKSSSQTLPEELNTEKARTLLQRAVKIGLCDDSYKWLKSKALLAYFADMASEYLGLGKGEYDGKKKVSWKPFETLFVCEKLSLAKQDYQKTGTLPDGYMDVNRLFNN